jgi:hypothetical protein
MTEPSHRKDQGGILTGRDIICFANDWQADPLSKKQVMVRLARCNRILWVNSMHNRRPRLAKKDARRMVQKVAEFIRGVHFMFHFSVLNGFPASTGSFCGASFVLRFGI